MKSEIRKQREMQILSILGKGGIMTAEQLMKLDAGGLGRGGRRNALRILREMERDGMVMSKRVGVKLFSIAGQGRFGFWEHRLVLVNFLIWKGWFDFAEIERPLIQGGVEILRPDAVMKLNGEWVGIEVDRRQKAKANKEKIEKYKKLGVRLIVVCYKDRARMWGGCQVHYIEDFT